LVIYLNDVELGGETAFPEIGLTVTAKKGSAVYFEYCNSQEHTDPLTLHAGLPVLKGEKWIATKWMRQNTYV
jgi:prolyl 4-hydroxylase